MLDARPESKLPGLTEVDDVESVRYDLFMYTRMLDMRREHVPATDILRGHQLGTTRGGRFQQQTYHVDDVQAMKELYALEND